MLTAYSERNASFHCHVAAVVVPVLMALLVALMPAVLVALMMVHFLS
jgi:hypothetical protein